MTRFPSEKAIENRIRLTICPPCQLTKNVVGKIQDNRRRWHVMGLGKGSADLVGRLKHRWISIEVKSKRRKLEDDQMQWAEMIQRGGAFTCVLRAASLEEAEMKARRVVELASSGVIDWEGWPWV